MSQPSILVYGRDARLLETRRWVLEQETSRVWTAVTLSQFDLLESDDPIDLLILCHSLSTEDCEPAIALATARWPGIKILALFAGMKGCHPGSFAGAEDAARGPAHLLKAVAQLVAA